MKTILLFLFLVCSALNLSASNQAEKLVDEYKDLKGFSDTEIKGATVALARPFIKKFPIGHLADRVTRIIILKMDKAPDADVKSFASDLKRLKGPYVYGGEYNTHNGKCEAYVHLLSDSEADEIVSYNPKKGFFCILYGKFPVSELQIVEK